MNYKAESPKLDLKLNLSPPRRGGDDQSPRSTSSVSSMELSPPSSCVSRETSPDDVNLQYHPPSSPEGTTSSMMLVGCPQCLMYVMLSNEDPKCPRCKSTVLLDFFHEERTKKPFLK